MDERFEQRIDPMLIKIIVAIESGTIVMVTALMLVSGAPGYALAIALGSIALPIVLLIRAVLRIRLEPDRLVWTFFPFWRGGVLYDDIETIEVKRVDAMRDFSGWGPKLGKGSFGAIARSGPAVWIGRRSKKRVLVLTSDEAETIARLLSARCPRAEVASEGGA